MKNLASYILMLTLTAGFIACDKDPIVTPDADQINFQAPEAGQRNYYLRYEGACGELTPTEDTLVLRVKKFENSIIDFEEEFTPGSPSYYPETIYPYQTKWSADNIEINRVYRQGSQLFFFYGSDSLRLAQSPTVNLQQDNCILWDGQTDFAGDFIGTVNRFKVANLEYQQKKIVSCVPTILNMDAYLVYDANNLYSSFTSEEGGWLPLEDPIVRAYALINKN